MLLAVLRICFILGFRNVFLVGCDFHMSTDERYWCDEEGSRNAAENNNESYRKLTSYFRALKPFFDREGFNVFNTNPNSALKVFEFANLDEALRQYQIDCSETTRGKYSRGSQ